MKRYSKPVILALISAVLITMCGCKGTETERQVIHVATKSMTEQYILGEILKAVIEENTELEVNVTKGVGGGTANIHAGLLAGSFDLCAEYTSTAWLHVLKETQVPDNETLYSQLQERYLSDYGLEWAGLYGFNNTFGLLVDAATVERYGLRTYSDLAEHSGELVFGAGYDFFEREDGYAALCAEYGMDFRETRDMDIGLKYTAFGEGKVNVITVYTTDAQVNVADGSILEDDRGFFVDYYCGTVVREEVLEQHPELREVLALLNGLISDEEMADMNYRLEVGHEDEAEIARDYLVGKGLIAAS